MDKSGQRVRPFLFRLPHIYYGWWVVIACFVIGFYTGGAVTYGFTTIFEPIVNEFGWSYAQVSLAASIRGVEVGLLAPLIGTILDRWGPRKMMLSGLTVAIIGLLLLSRISTLLGFYTAFILISIGISVGTNTATMATVANWFCRKAGVATGIMICGYGASGIVIPIMVKIIDAYSWQTAMVFLAAGIGVLCLPMALVVRHTPEKYGMLPDGDTEETVNMASKAALQHNPEASIGVREALKSRTFWHITIGLTIHMMAVQTFITHVMPYLSSVNISRSTASVVATAVPLVSLGGRFGFGWMADRMNKKKIVLITFTLLSLGTLFFETIRFAGIYMALPAIIAFGLGYGGNVVMTAVLPRSYFGMKHYGTILGCLQGVMLVGGIMGSPIAGWVFDTQGSYQYVWLALTLLVVSGAVALATIPSMKESRTVKS